MFYIINNGNAIMIRSMLFFKNSVDNTMKEDSSLLVLNPPALEIQFVENG